MNRTLTFISILILASCRPQTDQAHTEEVQLFEEVSPADVGMLVDSLELIGPHIRMAIDSQWIAGGVALVARHGKIVYHNATGSQ